MKIISLIETMGWNQIASDVREGISSPAKALNFLSKTKLNSYEMRKIAQAALLVLTGTETVNIDLLRESLSYQRA